MAGIFAAAMLDGCSENTYEREREERIKQNRAKLLALGIPTVLKHLVPLQFKKPRPKARAPKTPSTDNIPLRRSFRLSMRDSNSKDEDMRDTREQEEEPVDPVDELKIRLRANFPWNEKHLHEVATKLVENQFFATYVDTTDVYTPEDFESWGLDGRTFRMVFRAQNAAVQPQTSAQTR